VDTPLTDDVTTRDDVDDAPPIPAAAGRRGGTAPLVVVEAPPVPGMHAEESPGRDVTLPQRKEWEMTTALLVKTSGWWPAIRWIDARERRAAAGRGKIAGGSAAFASDLRGGRSPAGQREA
jgi:hypothetical protein